jgi:molybdate/tungstate transport system substrate-binding protein
MWENPTSMHRAALVVAVVAVAGLAFVAGWIGSMQLGGGSSGTTADSRSKTLSIAAAGTLGTLFPQAASALVNQTPGISAPSATQTYEGSLLALASVKLSGASIDVAAAADYRLIPQILEPTVASWEVVFATTPEVLAYDPSVAAFSGINSTNWAAKLETPGVLLGVANASTDPNGYNGIFVLELQGQVDNGSLSSVYSHFYTTPVGALAIPDPTTTRVEPEAQAATLLAAHTVGAFIIYRSFAVTHHLAFIDLSPQVNLGDLSPAAVTLDGQASTSILTSAGTTQEVVGAPVAYAATVPKTSANDTLGLAFLHYLLSPAGVALMQNDGFVAVFPGWADDPARVPPLLAPDVVGLPIGLPAV